MFVTNNVLNIFYSNISLFQRYPCAIFIVCKANTLFFHINIAFKSIKFYFGQKLFLYKQHFMGYFKLKILTSFFLPSLLLISSCCIFNTDPPDLRITGQSYPSTVNANQRFDLTFTVGNFSSGDCDAEKTNQGVVNLKLTNRITGAIQVNNTETLDPLDYNETQVFNFSVIIGPENAGTYDLLFTVDPNNTTGDSDRNNNTQTGIIVVN